MGVLASLIGAGVSGGLGLVGANNADSGGYKDPDLLDPSSMFNMFVAFLSNRAYRKAFQEYSGATDQDIEMLRKAGAASGPETLAAYDDSSEKALETLQRLSERQGRDAQSLYGATRRSRTGFLDDFQQRGDELQRGYGAGMDQFMSGLRGDEANILGGYDDRYTFAEKELEGYGTQQKSDIDERFDNEREARMADLVSRGLRASTVAGSEGALVEKERSNEQRRLGEDLARNRVNVLGGIMGERSAAEERLAGKRAGYGYGGVQAAYQGQTALDASQAAYDAALRGDVLAAQKYMSDVDAANSGNMTNYYTNTASNRANITQSGFRDFMDSISQVSRVPPPSPSGTLQQLGANMAPVPKPPSATGYALGAMAPGVGNAAGALFTNWMNRPPITPSTSLNTSYSPYVNVGGWGGSPNPYGTGMGYDPYGYGPPAW